MEIMHPIGETGGIKLMPTLCRYIFSNRRRRWVAEIGADIERRNSG
jgi:hypothetical protein